MNRRAGILHHQIAQHRGLAGFGIDLDIDDMDAKAGAHTARRHFVVARDRPAGAAHLGGDLGDGHRRELARIGAGGHGRAVAPFHRLGIDAPFRSRAARTFRRSLARRPRPRPCRWQRWRGCRGWVRSPPAPPVSTTFTRTVHRQCPEFPPSSAPSRRGCRRYRACRPTPHRAILANRQRHRGFAAMVEPEPRRHAAPLIGAKRHGQSWGAPWPPPGFRQADAVVGGAIAGLRALRARRSSAAPSMGSSPSSRHISSSRLSTAKAAIGEPGAR